MKIMALYHQVQRSLPCPDGLAAAWVVQKRFPEAECRPVRHGEPVPKLPPLNGRPGQIYIVDFSYPPKILARWRKAGWLVTVIDHHKTAQAPLSRVGGDIQVFFDLTECGASLTWQTLFPGQPMPAFLQFVRERDLWQKSEWTDAIAAAMRHLGHSFELCDRLAPLTKAELIAELGELGQQAEAAHQDQALKIARRYQWEMPPRLTQRVPVVRLRLGEEGFVSDVCAILNTQLAPDAAFVAALMPSGAVSLRSQKAGSNFDVGALAESVGGGGHHNASGYRSRA